MSKYRPIYKKIWKDKDFKKSSKDSKLLFLYLTTNDGVNNSGIYEIPISTISEETGITQPNVKKLLQSDSIKNIRYDMENEIVFVVNARKYSPGGNPSQVEKGIISEFKENSKTFLWNLFLEVNPQFKDIFSTVGQPLTNGSIPIPLPIPIDSKDLTNDKPLKMDWKTEKQEAFDKRFSEYAGSPDSKKLCNGYWNTSIQSPGDIKAYDSAYENYYSMVRTCNYERNFKGAKTWFNNWKDYIPKKPVTPLAEEPVEPAPPPKERVRGDHKLEKLWDDTLDQIKADIKPDAFETWFKPTYPKIFEDGKLIVAVPNQFVRKSLIENYRGKIEQTLRNLTGNPVMADFCIQP